MNISKFSVKKPVTIIMGVLIVITLGIVSLAKLPLDLLPNIEIPVAIVNTSYANVSPEEIEKLITKPIEQAVGTVENIDSISSMSKEGSSVVVVQFKYGTDMNFTVLKMREKIDMVKGVLPEDAASPVVMQIDPNSQPIIQMAITGNADLGKIQTIAEDVIQPKLERIEGVASVSTSGGYEKEIKISLNQEKLKGYGLSIDYISQILSSENLNLPGGRVKRGNQELLIRTIGEFKSIEEIKNIPIPLKTGGSIYLNDIAQVGFDNKDVSAISKMDGKKGINITIQKQSGTNTVTVAKEVNKEIENIKKKYPTLQIKSAFDQSDYINKSIDNVAKNAVAGALLAILILYIFLRNIRSTFIIGTAIPTSIIATFILIYFDGITLNLMTLGGLALGVGMLVDNSIVVLENIYRFRQEGYSKKEAAVKGASEVTMAVIASTLTTIAVFLPIAFIEGIASTIFKELALTVTFSLAASLVVSLTLIPMLSSKILKVDGDVKERGEKKVKIFSKIYNAFDKVFYSIESKYRNLLKWSLEHRKTVVLVAIVIFILSIGSLKFVGKEFFPQTDEGAFQISVELPEGSKVKNTESIMDDVQNKIHKISEIDTIFETTGGNSLTGGGENLGSLYVKLKAIKDRKRSTSQVMDEIANIVKDIPGAKITLDAESMSMGVGGSPVSITIEGDDLDTLKKLGEQFKGIIASVKGTREVKSSLADGVLQAEITLNRERSSQYGLTAAQVANQVKSMISGKTATKYKLNGDEIDVVIKGDESFKESLMNINQILIETQSGVSVPLELVAKVDVKRGPVEINRENQIRTVTVTSQITGRDLGSIVEEVKGKIEKINIPNGYTYKIGGQNEEMVDAFKDLALALVLAIALVYMILASQFESLLNPFIIMFSLPLAIAGGILGLFITRRALSVPSIIGFILLAGIVVNNAIVLIDYINTRRENGEDIKEAILNAGPIRLRPIMMTALTTILGLIPLALGIGEGSEIQAPMASVVIGGLLLSTLLTLVFVPVVYTMFDNLKCKLHGRKRKKVTIN